MRLGISVILLVTRPKERSLPNPKGLGNVASRPGLSYTIAQQCSRSGRGGSWAVGRLQMGKRPVPQGLPLGGAGTRHGRTGLGILVETDPDRALRSGLEVRTPARPLPGAGEDVVPSLLEAAGTVDGRPSAGDRVGIPSGHGTRVPRGVSHRRLRAAGGRW